LKWNAQHPVIGEYRQVAGRTHPQVLEEESKQTKPPMGLVQSVRADYLILLAGTLSSSYLGLLGQQDGVDVGQDTSRGNCDISEESVQFFIILYCQGNVTGDDTALLVVSGGVSGEFENFGAKVFEDSSEVDGGTGSHAGGELA
jgi:hypothetical protein